MSGLTCKEQEIMDLWDSGLSVERIAAKTGNPKTLVNSIVSRFTRKATDAWQAEAAIASDALAQAVQRCIQNGGAG